MVGPFSEILQFSIPCCFIRLWHQVTNIFKHLVLMSACLVGVCQALDVLLDLCTSSCEQSRNCINLVTDVESREDTRSSLECSENVSNVIFAFMSFIGQNLYCSFSPRIFF